MKKTDKIVYVIVVVIVMFLAYYFGISYYAEYMNHKDAVVLQNATVTNITEHTDYDSDDYYKIYISYIYNDTECIDVYWDTEYSRKYDVGDVVEIKIDPDNPGYILDEETRGDIMIFIILIAVAGLIYYKTDKRYENKVEMLGEKKLITDKKIAFDLRPKILTAAAEILISIAVGTVILYCLLAELFYVGYLWWMAVVFVLGVAFQVLAISLISKMPEKKYSLNSLVCEQKWIDNFDDSTNYYVKFPGVYKVSCNKLDYLQMCEGSHYYVLQKQNGDVRGIYPISEWRLAVEDRSLESVYKILIKKVWYNLILSVAFETVFVFVFAFVTQLFIR